MTAPSSPDHCRHLTRCADAACAYRMLAREVEADLRERLAAEVEALRDARAEGYTAAYLEGLDDAASIVRGQS